MPDDPTQVFRAYAVIDASLLAVAPTLDQWKALRAQLLSKPMAQAIMSWFRASQNEISMHKLAQGTGLNKYALLVFEIDADYKTVALNKLNQVAANDGVTGTVTQKLAGVLQYEIRQAILALGFTSTQANKVVVTVLNDPGVFDRDGAMAAAVAYVAAQDLVWHSAV